MSGLLLFKSFYGLYSRPQSLTLQHIFILFLICAFVLISGCSDDNAVNPEPVYGWQGTVLNDSGKVLEGVQVYCLFYYQYIPPTAQKNISGFNITDSVFQNNLFQNIPNPVTVETYFRFSVRSKSYVELNLKSRLTGETVSAYSDTLYYGLYQHYAGELGSDSLIKNGIYDYSIKITPLSGETFEDEKDLLIISDQTKPNTVSDKKGYYLFDSREAFTGEVVKEVSINNPLEITEKTIPEEIYLLFKKEGYYNQVSSFRVVPGALYTRDIILTGVVK